MMNSYPRFRSASRPIWARTVFGIVLAAILGLANGASALTISQDTNFLLGSDLVVQSGNTFGQRQVDNTLVFGQFNPSLGILTNVTFNLTSTLGDAAADSPLALFITGYSSTPIHSVGSNIYTTSVSDSVSGDLFGSSVVNDLECMQAGGLCTATDNEHAGEVYDDSIDALPLPGYTGTGSIDVILSQLIELSIVPLVAPGGAEASFIGRWFGNIEVVYTYNLIPEPSSSLLLGLGLIALTGGSTQRRRLPPE